MSLSADRENWGSTESPGVLDLGEKSPRLENSSAGSRRSKIAGKLKKVSSPLLNGGLMVGCNATQTDGIPLGISQLRMVRKIKKYGGTDREQGLPEQYRNLTHEGRKSVVRELTLSAAANLTRSNLALTRLVFNILSISMLASEVLLSTAGVGGLVGLGVAGAAFTGVGGSLGVVLGGCVSAFHLGKVAKRLHGLTGLRRLRRRAEEMQSQAAYFDSLHKTLSSDPGSGFLHDLAKHADTMASSEMERTLFTSLFKDRKFDQLATILLLNQAKEFAGSSEQLKTWRKRASLGYGKPDQLKALKAEMLNTMAERSDFLTDSADALRAFAKLQEKEVKRNIFHHTISAGFWGALGLSAGFILASAGGLSAVLALPIAFGLMGLSCCLFIGSRVANVGTRKLFDRSDRKKMLAQEGGDLKRCPAKAAQAYSRLGVEYRLALLAEKEMSRFEKMGFSEKEANKTSPLLHLVSKRKRKGRGRDRRDLEQLFKAKAEEKPKYETLHLWGQRLKERVSRVP